MPIARLAVAACALLTLAGCGVPHPSEAAQPTHTTSPTTERSESPADPPATDPTGDSDDEVRKSIDKDVVLTASAPKTFTPSDTAYPRSSRAVAIDVAIDNGGSIAFRPSQLSFTATVDGAPTEQVIDSTQGYNGVSGATDEVAPDQSLRFNVAFAVPEKACAVRISVRTAQPTSTAIELYDGVV
ncbi:hypothetical protein [Actinophytocola sp.]|uniref:hypothetical protein n=1 Tax=Actinophytocola sp. TaxID=1872138 RepID=UPI003D6B92FD